MMVKDKIIDDIQTSALDNSAPVEEELAVEQQEHIEQAAEQEPVCKQADVALEAENHDADEKESDQQAATDEKPAKNRQVKPSETGLMASAQRFKENSRASAMIGKPKLISSKTA